MEILEAKGLVLKSINIKEYDRLLIVFLKDYGKRAVVARSARKSGSRFMAGSDIFVYSDFVIKSKNNFTYISQIDIIKSFYDLRNYPDLMKYGNYFLEFTEKILPEHSEQNEILRLLLKTLSVLSKRFLENQLIYCIFSIKLLQLSGYQPITESCHVCGIGSTDTKFFSKYGVVCDSCAKKVGFFLPISQTSIYTIKFILDTDIRDIFSFRLNKSNVLELISLVDFFRKSHLDFSIKSI